MRSDHFNCQTINGFTLQQVIGDWYFNRNSDKYNNYHLIDICKQPNCNPSVEFHWPCTNLPPNNSSDYKWRLTFGHQYGYNIEAHIGAQAELFTFAMNGSADNQIGLTNKYNNNTDIFGKGDQFQFVTLFQVFDFFFFFCAF